MVPRKAFKRLMVSGNVLLWQINRFYEEVYVYRELRKQRFLSGSRNVELPLQRGHSKDCGKALNMGGPDRLVMAFY